MPRTHTRMNAINNYPKNSWNSFVSLNKHTHTKVQYAELANKLSGGGFNRVAEVQWL